jgi:hypothetical protein
MAPIQGPFIGLKASAVLPSATKYDIGPLQWSI